MVEYVPGLGALHKWISSDPYLQSYDYSEFATPKNAKHIVNWYPSLRPFFFQFEEDWRHGGPSTLWARDHQYYPLICVVLYVVVIFGIKAFMKNRDFIDVRYPQMFWNSALALFSICGAIRMLPFAIAFVWNEGLLASICTSPVVGFGGAGPTAFWTCLFIYSKIPELFDTLFVVLNKKPLLFLHWYHHITVLLFCWFSYAERASVGLSFCAMNYTVHAVMYTYYALQNKNSLATSRAKRITDEAARERAMRGPKRMAKTLRTVAPVITVMQISQMVVGVWVMYAAYPYLNEPTVKCHTTRSIWFWGTIMYMSYFVLFVLFAIEKYICPTESKPKGDKGE